MVLYSNSELVVFISNETKKNSSYIDIIFKLHIY